jgi:hypothetical protein
MSFAADFPDMYANMKREERDTRALIGTDQCVIDQRWFFIRGCLEVPILGSDEPFVWGLWASIMENVYDEMSDCWTLEGREKLHDRRRDSHPGFRTELENLVGDAKGEGPKRKPRKADSTDVPSRGGLLRSSDETG